MNSGMRIKKVYGYTKSFHRHDTTGRGITHVECVYNDACYITKRENITGTLVIELSPLLHDTVDSKLADETLTYDWPKQFLSTLDSSGEISQQVLYIIEHISYRAGKNNHVKLSIDGEIVRDTGRLDTIGAIGTARTFQFSRHSDKPMWAETKLSNEELHTPLAEELDNLAIKHFHEKLFRLKDLMHTPTAEKPVEERH